MTVCPFTSATPTYRRAASLAADPMPLTAYEVAEYGPRWPATRIVRTVVECVACVGFIIFVWSALNV